MAAAPNFKLGVNYSVPISAESLTTITNVAAATDSDGGIYVLLNSAQNGATAPLFVSGVPLVYGGAVNRPFALLNNYIGQPGSARETESGGNSCLPDRARVLRASNGRGRHREHISRRDRS